jgi:hypothetical protein
MDENQFGLFSQDSCTPVESPSAESAPESQLSETGAESMSDLVRRDPNLSVDRVDDSLLADQSLLTDKLDHVSDSAGEGNEIGIDDNHPIPPAAGERRTPDGFPHSPAEDGRPALDGEISSISQRSSGRILLSPDLTAAEPNTGLSPVGAAETHRARRGPKSRTNFETLAELVADSLFPKQLDNTCQQLIASTKQGWPRLVKNLAAVESSVNRLEDKLQRRSIPAALRFAVPSLQFTKSFVPSHNDFHERWSAIATPLVRDLELTLTREALALKRDQHSKFLAELDWKATLFPQLYSACRLYQDVFAGFTCNEPPSLFDSDSTLLSIQNLAPSEPSPALPLDAVQTSLPYRLSLFFIEQIHDGMVEADVRRLIAQCEKSRRNAERETALSAATAMAETLPDRETVQSLVTTSIEALGIQQQLLELRSLVHSLAPPTAHSPPQQPPTSRTTATNRNPKAGHSLRLPSPLASLKKRKRGDLDTAACAQLNLRAAEKLALDFATEVAHRTARRHTRKNKDKPASRARRDAANHKSKQMKLTGSKGKNLTLRPGTPTPDSSLLLSDGVAVMMVEDSPCREDSDRCSDPDVDPPVDPPDDPPASPSSHTPDAATSALDAPLPQRQPRRKRTLKAVALEVALKPLPSPGPHAPKRKRNHGSVTHADDPCPEDSDLPPPAPETPEQRHGSAVKRRTNSRVQQSSLVERSSDDSYHPPGNRRRGANFRKKGATGSERGPDSGSGAAAEAPCPHGKPPTSPILFQSFTAPDGRTWSRLPPGRPLPPLTQIATDVEGAVWMLSAPPTSHTSPHPSQPTSHTSPHPSPHPPPLPQPSAGLSLLSSAARARAGGDTSLPYAPRSGGTPAHSGRGMHLPGSGTAQPGSRHHARGRGGAR